MRLIYEDIMNNTLEGVDEIHQFLGIDLENKTKSYVMKKLEDRQKSFSDNERGILLMKRRSKSFVLKNIDKSSRWTYFYSSSDLRVIGQSCQTFFNITKDFDWVCTYISFIKN